MSHFYPASGVASLISFDISVITVAIFAGGGRIGLDHNLVLLLALSAGLCLRLLALRFGWGMPKFVYKHDLH